MSEPSLATTAKSEAPPAGERASELFLAENARRVTIPYAGGDEYICPGCEQPIPNRRIVYLGKPAKFAHVLNDVIRCPRRDCRFVFSPRNEIYVIRE